MWGVLTTGNDFACIIVFSTIVHITVFAHSPVAHDLILPSVCARRAYPRRFLGRVGRTPYHPHSLGDGSKCRRGKGLKTICLGPTRTSDLYYELCDLMYRSLFGVPDEITDMTRSLEMAERFICWPVCLTYYFPNGSLRHTVWFNCVIRNV